MSGKYIGTYKRRRMISLNYQAFSLVEMSAGFVWVMNLTLALCIVLMMGIIMIFVNKAKSKGFLTAYIVILAVLAAAVIVTGIIMFA